MKKLLVLILFISYQQASFAQVHDVVTNGSSFSGGNGGVSNSNLNNNNSSGSGNGSYNTGNSSTNNTGYTNDNSNSNYNWNDVSREKENNYRRDQNYNNNNSQQPYHQDKYTGYRGGWDNHSSMRCYVRIGFGYAFTQTGQTLNENGDAYSGTLNFDSSHSQFSYSDLKKVSFSTGLQAVLTAGWMLNKNVGVEINGYIGMAPKKYTAHFNDVLVNGSYAADVTVTNKAKSPIFIAPCVVFQTPGKVLGLYARAGIVIPVNGKVMREDNYHFYPPGFGSYINNISIGYKLTTSMSIGYTAAMGMKYNVNRHISLWAEASMVSISLNIKQVINTMNNADGQASLLYPTVDYGFNGSNVNRSTQRGVQPSYSEPFSNVGINAGVAFNF